MQDYNLITNNCNNFTNECSEFLVGRGIPSDIINLPNEMLATPMGAMLRPLVDRQVQSMNEFYQQNGHETLSHQQQQQLQQQEQQIAPPVQQSSTPGETLLLFDKLHQADRVVAKFKEFVYTNFVELSADERRAVADVGVVIDFLNQDANCALTPQHRQDVVHLSMCLRVVDVVL